MLGVCFELLQQLSFARDPILHCRFLTSGLPHNIPNVCAEHVKRGVRYTINESEEDFSWCVEGGEGKARESRMIIDATMAWKTS